jgi:hypothetical protein
VSSGVRSGSLSTAVQGAPVTRAVTVTVNLRVTAAEPQARERGGTADAPGLGPGVLGRGGSNPPARTTR